MEEWLLPVATKTIHPPGRRGRNDFSIHLLAFLCRQQQQDSARNALTHPRSALDENSLVRRRRLHPALRPLVDSEGGGGDERGEERRGEAATSIRRRESGKNSDYLQTTRFLPPPSTRSLNSFHFIPSCCRFNLSWNDCNVRPTAGESGSPIFAISQECRANAIAEVSD